MFLSKLEISPSPIDETKWVLGEPLIYKSSASLTIIVPKEYETDLASIPRILWSIMPPFGFYSSAAVVHDWIYNNKGSVSGYFLTRKRADTILLNAMLESNVPKIKAYTIYHAVRLFGASHW